MKKAVFILLFFVGIVFQIAADNHNQGTPSEPKNPDQPQAAAVQAAVPADGKTPAVKEVGKNTGENTVQPQKKESGQGKQSAPTGTPAADTKLDTGSKPSTDNKPVANAGKKDPTTTNKTVQSENNDVSNEDNTVPDEGRSEYTQNKADAAVVSNLAAAVESANRSAKEAEMHSQQVLSDLKQYSRYWDEQYNRMSISILLSMLVIIIIVCILFFTQRKKMSELEKSFRQQIKDIQYQQRNSRDNKAIQGDAVEHRSNDRGTQDLLSQAAVKTAIDRKQPPITQSLKMETVRPKSTGYAEQSNDNLSALYASEAEREKWLALGLDYSCLKVPESIRNRLFAGEKLSFREIALTPSGNLNNALFILLDDKLYLNFRLYNAKRELPADIEHIVGLVYDFDQPFPRYVKGCRPARVGKANNGYTIWQKGKIVPA